MKKETLLVCYSFPPNPGVGGRRWAKLSAALQKENCSIEVLMKTPETGDSSPWTNDVSGIPAHTINPDYPKILDRAVSSVSDRIRYHLALLYMKLTTSSNYYDRAVRLQKRYLNWLGSYFGRKDCRNIIVTGGPFSILYYTALYKEQNSDIFYIADIRDSWLSNDFYGFGLLSERRRQVEKARLLKVLNTADVILVPYEKMRTEYSAIAKPDADIRVLPHGTDSSMIKPRNVTDPGTFVHFGSHYHGLNHVFTGLAESLKTHPEITINFYTADYKYQNVFESSGLLGEKVKYHNLISEADVYEKMSEATAVLLFTPGHMKDFISTKFMEAVSARVPIIVIGEFGDAADFVQKNKLGVFIEAEKVGTEFSNIPQALSRLNYNTNFDVSPYLFSNQAIWLKDILKTKHDN